MVIDWAPLESITPRFSDRRGSQLLDITLVVDMAQGRRSMPIPQIFGRNMRHRIVAVYESEHTPVGLIDDALAKYFIAGPRTPKGIERSIAAAKTAHRKC